MSQLDQIFNNPSFTPALQKQINDVIAEETVTRNYVDKIMRGVYRHGMLIGAPGLGKSYAVSQALKQRQLTEGRDFMIVKGHCTPLQLFKLLYLFRKPGQFLVIDDCDVEQDRVGLELLKAATDPDNSQVNWSAGSIPMIGGQPVDSFVFKGSVIICTNYFERTGRPGSKDAKRDALFSRVTPRRVNWDTRDKQFAQLFNMVINADYLSHRPETQLTDDQKAQLVLFICENRDRFVNLDLRLPIKIAVDMLDTECPDWQEFAEHLMAR